MLNTLARMYITLAPAIFAGILNMVWCKSSLLRQIQVPIDGGRTLRDGKRIFGENKTWKGVAGMVLFGCVTATMWGFLCGAVPALERNNYFYVNYENTAFYNAVLGAAAGLMYALFELPNSFLKRRLDITPGKTYRGAGKVFFIFLDQADSVFGCVLVVCAVYPMSPLFYFLYVLVGAVTHILLNVLLYFCHLRRNLF